MPTKNTRNLGATRLRKRKRHGDPMSAYDALPTPLRQWLAQAALPWSPSSAKRAWNNARAKGLCVDEALCALSRTEMQMLARDKPPFATH